MNIRKQIRKEEAAVRQAEYDALSTVEKVQRAHGRRGNSERELTRLYARAKREQEAA